MPPTHWNIPDALFDKVLLASTLGTLLRESVYPETAGSILPSIFYIFWKCQAARKLGWRSSHMKTVMASRYEVDAKVLSIINTEHTLKQN